MLNCRRRQLRPSNSLPSTNMLSAIGLRGELFHTPTDKAFAIPVNDHRETWPIRSQRFRNWLRRCYYEATGEAASAAAIRSALDLCEARAQFDGRERAVHIRVAEHAGYLYLDLADEHWRAVQIGPDGWQVIASPPVRFRRPPGMRALPEPERGGSIEACLAAAILRRPESAGAAQTMVTVLTQTPRLELPSCNKLRKAEAMPVPAAPFGGRILLARN
jgi:hypothetical protein